MRCRSLTRPRGLTAPTSRQPPGRSASTRRSHSIFRARPPDSTSVAFPRPSRCRTWSASWRSTLTYNGQFSTLDPAIALQDPRMAASLTGSTNVRTTVRDLLTRTPEASDYDIEGQLDLQHSSIRGLDVEAAHVQGQVRDAVASLAR